MNIHPDNRTAYEAQANLIVANQETARADFMARPSVMLGVKPRKQSDGTWIAYYGDIIGMGTTPDEAMADFDLTWAGKPDPK